MISDSLLKKIDGFLKSRPIWLNSSEVVEGEEFRVEFYIKNIKGKFFVGYDRYNEKYENPADLYDCYIRKDFPDLRSAIEFIDFSLPIDLEDLNRSISS